MSQPSASLAPAAAMPHAPAQNAAAVLRQTASIRPAVPMGTLNGLNVPYLPLGTRAQAMYTKSEIEQHNSATDCWVIIDGKVVDVTSLMTTHSGGAAAILPYAGQDATQRFTALHGPSAARILSPLIIGGVKQEARF